MGSNPIWGSHFSSVSLWSIHLFITSYNSFILHKIVGLLLELFSHVFIGHLKIKFMYECMYYCKSYTLIVLKALGFLSTHANCKHKTVSPIAYGSPPSESPFPPSRFPLPIELLSFVSVCKHCICCVTNNNI